MISICSHFKTAVLSSVTRQRRARDYPCLFSHQERLCSISAEEERDEGKGESERRLGQKLKNGKLAAFESDIREETWDAKRKDAIGRTKSKGRLRRSLVLSTLGSDSAWQKHPKRLSSDKRDVRFWFRRYGRTEKRKKETKDGGTGSKAFLWSAPAATCSPCVQMIIDSFANHRLQYRQRDWRTTSEHRIELGKSCASIV